MSRRLKKAGRLLRQSLDYVPGLLTGNAIATPALASTDITFDELRMPLLIGSLVLLIIGLAFKARRDRIARSAPRVRSNGFSEGIGRYRLQFGRGDAD